jgi:restriction system protein
MTLWMVRGGKWGEHERVALESGLACIGFEDMPDLSRASTRELMFDLVRKSNPETSENGAYNSTGQLFAFAHRMKPGDTVAMPLKNRSQVAIGRIIGQYSYRTDLGEIHHVRPVEWIRTDIPRTAFAQDLLYSLGSAMTVCRIQRNDAETRFKNILEGKPDVSVVIDNAAKENQVNGEVDKETEPLADVERFARDQILGYLEKHFKGHDLVRLVDAVLCAEGYVTHFSEPGPDGGVDILAGRGTLGFDGPKLCVQVKSSKSPADVRILRELQGSMATFKADQGLLVSWGGFNNPVMKESRQSFFSVRLWDADNLVEALLRNYERLPEDLKSELPLKRIWALVPEESDIA